ncbi:hypothetical protein LOCC1_G005335 [Lachnellula occidentalis]|uniref:Aminoglycoside phosphotransferase domain-containing protein n=1 Tax=Lachnellula occidentalis TaxID=215460 RepID=A0A8H8RTY5_9HELO|nr:hypothetical protein LOCC1_G005335 [Lachnellula occidentalis]
MDKHFDLRTWITIPIRETLREIDSNTWLIGPFIVYRSNDYCNTATWFDDSDNSSYTIANASNPPPAATLLSPDNPYITQVYDAGDASTVWSIGTKVFCKVHICYSEERTTPEDVTLKWVRDRHPSFQVPEVLDSATHDYRTILFLTRLPGRTLANAWPELSKEWRQYYVKAVVNICQTMAEWEGDRISGVDGQNMPENYMTEQDNSREHPIDYSPETLENSCRSSLGMDCSSFVFYHADLNPTNIIVNDQCVGIIDWEIAGYVPRGWIRTKFLISAAM